MTTKQLQTRDLVESVMRLRRLDREADRGVRDEIEPVLSYLESVAGSTVTRAEAARLFGVSQTALDRWVRKGEISSVVTPRGRREIPLVQVVDLLEQVREKEGSGDRLALASVIRERRRDAEQIDPRIVLPSSNRRRRTHKKPELLSLVYHRTVAHRLDEPLVREARKRLSRWRKSDAIHPQWADEWDRVLEMPVAKIAKLISSNSEHARELRQSSPFAGALTEQERRRVVRMVEDRVNA
jgi:DNA-binding transcriptional MerR regulator